MGGGSGGGRASKGRRYSPGAVCVCVCVGGGGVQRDQVSNLNFSICLVYVV